MKTTELKQTAFEYGFKCVHDDGQIITFEDCLNECGVAQIDKEKMFGIYLFPEFNDLPIGTQEKAYELFYEYGKTPIRDRENKRFRLKHKYLQEKIDDCDDLSNPVLKAFNVICSKRYKEKEIEELEYEFSELIKDFEIVEVKTTKEYKYGVRERDFLPSAFPKEGLIRAEDGSKQGGIKYYYFLFYNRRLSDDELKGLDFDYLGNCEVEK